MAGWYVSIDHLTEDQLLFLGYRDVGGNEEFTIYSHYTGDEYIVTKGSPRFLHVEDLNDVAAINSTRVTSAPPG